MSDYILLFCADENIGSVGDGNRPLCILPQCQARDAEHSGLFLNAAGIRQNEFGIGHKAEKVEITQWLYAVDTWSSRFKFFLLSYKSKVFFQLEFLDAVHCAGMNRKDDRNFLCDGR